MRSTGRRLRLSLDLLLQRSLGLCLAVDVLILSGVLVQTLASNDPEGFYYAAVIPLFLLGVPILSDTVALERRAGSLDLALSAPGAARYFERRVATFCAVMALQGTLVLLVARLAVARYLLAPALLQLLLTAAVIGAVVLFWAVRLRGPGAVAFASLLTLLALQRWLLANPVRRVGWTVDAAADWLGANAVLAGAAAMLYLYARRRLSRPETLL